MTYGELIREIRIKKNITQKYLYQSIMSKSYAIRFEQGKHEISFFLFNQILEKIPMEVDEFLYIYNHYHESQSESFYNEYGHYGNINDITGLLNLKNKISNAVDNNQINLKIAELTARIDQLNDYNETGIYRKEKIDEQALNLIMTHLENIQDWTIDELRFLANTIDYIDYKERLDYFKLLLPKIRKYKEFGRGKKVICTLLINAVRESILLLDIETAKILLKELDYFSNGIEELFFRISYFYYIGLILIYENELLDGEKKVNNAIDTLENLEFHYQANLFKETYTQFKKIVAMQEQ